MNSTNKNIFTKLMSMDEKTWERHANPLSVWTRVLTGLPTIMGAVWCMKPFGYISYYILVVVCFWIWINPRLFPIPKSTNNWASKVTFGERVWLNRKTTGVPQHHISWAFFLSFLAGIGFFLGLYGAYNNYFYPMILGSTISWFSKMWFCDRMVWLFEDVKLKNSQYASWVKE